MKNILLHIFCIVSVINLPAQITTPVVKANFGVDGDLRANYFNGSSLSTTDDWFKNSKFAGGEFIIDTTGAAGIVNNYTSNPASRMSTFSRLMHPPFYSTLQNMLVIDAVFHRDFHGDDSTVFASGSNKNGMSPALWSCPVSQGIPDKNDILDAFTHVRRDGPNVTDSLWLFGGLSIENTNGNRYFDFELYQTDIVYNRSSRTFTGYGPDAGHTSWLFNASGQVIKAGDIIFSAEYSSSSLTLIQARIWINKNSLSVTPVNFDWGGDFDGDGSGALYGYATIVPKSAGAFYTGLQSPAVTWAGPFSLVRANNDVVSDYIDGQFMEFSVNLSKLGVDPGSYSNNPCGTIYRRVLIKSRSSTSFTSELKDFIAPFSMFDFPKVDAFSFVTLFCGVFPLTPVTVVNPSPTSVYTWSTTTGHIVGSNTGTTIMVDAPGRYYVTQQLNSQCPYYSIDSIDFFFQNVCHVLDVNILNFTAARSNNTASFKWQVNNNKDAAQCSVEYSEDGNSFFTLATIAAGTQTDVCNYQLNYAVDGIKAAVVYYRIKVTGKNGAVKYSNIIAMRNHGTESNTASIFPNPTKGELWIAVRAGSKETVPVQIWNAQGKIISSTTIQLTAGENLVQLPGLVNAAAGIYFVKANLLSGSITQKVLKPN